MSTSHSSHSESTNAGLSSAPQKSRLSPPPPKAIAEALGLTDLTVDWLAGDGSDRCYYRICNPNTKKSYVLMQLSGSDLNHLQAGTYEWIEMSGILSEFDILVPKPVVTMRDHGALIIEDYGDVMLETKALEYVKQGDLSKVLPLYFDCIETLSKFISIRPSGSPSWTKRSFDEERFTWELNFFVTKYMEGVCKRPLKGEEKIKFSNDVRSLSKFLSSGSRYFVHRDFHSRNVMVADSKIAVIDFQDARLGPVSYDLVSLCFDSYVPFSKDQRRSLMDRGIEAFEGKFGVQIADECKSQWRPMLLQRQLKAIGSFGYLTVDKHKGDYLKNVAPALETLDPNLVFDSRWPFLSGKLLEILEETLPTKFSSPNKALKT